MEQPHHNTGRDLDEWDAVPRDGPAVFVANTHHLDNTQPMQGGWVPPWPPGWSRSWALAVPKAGPSSTRSGSAPRWSTRNPSLICSAWPARTTVAEPEQQPDGNQPERREQARAERPRIYVASLADYNAGRLHGAWIDAAAEPEPMWAAIQTMLAASPEPDAEEFAIHDYENFGPLQLSEYESIDTIAVIANGVALHGRAFLHWVAYIGTGDVDSLERFEDCYLGQWATTSEYAAEIADSHGLDALLDEHVPGFLRPYVNLDIEAFGRDISCSFHVAEDDGGVYVFEP